MLSICIPVYNSDVSELVYSLINQIEQLDSPIEICVIDDASSAPKYDLSKICHPKVTIHKNAKNAGRSRVRNQFLALTNYSHLLFLDGDSRIIRSDFLKIYCELLKTSRVEVVCGASVYQIQKPNRDYYLRWKYSIERESKSIDERKKNKHLGFKTNNFIIHREIFKENQFNELITGYGHEDSLFGYDLAKSNVQIEHVENPVLNFHLDDNLTFLMKTKEAVRNLKFVLQIVDFDRQFLYSNKLSRIYFLICRIRVKWLIYFVLSIIHPINNFFLLKGYFALPMFDLFKLFYILKTDKQ